MIHERLAAQNERDAVRLVCFEMEVTPALGQWEIGENENEDQLCLSGSLIVRFACEANVQQTVMWKNAFGDSGNLPLDSFCNLSSIMVSLRTSPSKWELQMLSFKVVEGPQMKLTIVSFNDNFFTYMKSLNGDSTEALHSVITAPSDRPQSCLFMFSKPPACNISCAL